MATSLRYERVAGAEGSSASDHLSVYNPEQMDDTAAIIARGGELETSTSEPIGFREIFNDPRLSPRQQKFCVVTLLTIGCITLLMLISLFAGFGKVLFDIRARELRSKHGIVMIPNLRKRSANAIFYNVHNRSANTEKYANEIHEYLEKYRGLQGEIPMSTIFKNCSPVERSEPSDWCYFNAATEFGPACSRENNYGFDDDSPCILFAFEDRLNWTPKFSGPPSTFLPFACRTQYQYQVNSFVNLTYYPSLGSLSRIGGFYMNQIPSRQLKKKDDGSALLDETGDLLYTVPPLVMVKLSLSKEVGSFTMDCRIKDAIRGFEFTNIEDFKGQTGIAFDFSTTDS